MENLSKRKGKKFKFPFPTEVLTEGSIKLTVPSLSLYAIGASEYIPSKAPVFYNPLMEMNRDIAVLVLRVYQRRVDKNLLVCDPLSGCGVRGLRFAKEVNNIDSVVLNDLNPEAAKLTQFNLEMNCLSDQIIVKNCDANFLLGHHSSPGERFDVIDIDPYGSPTPFLDSAVRALRSNGLIALTATDMAVLCGVNDDVCIRKYFGKSLRVEYCNELAIRLLINALVFAAAKHGFGIKMIFSHCTDHYVRVYAQIKRGAMLANKSINRIGYVLHCFNCLNRKWSFGFANLLGGTCDVCGSRMEIAGPMWLDQIFDVEFCTEMVEEVDRVSLGTKKRLLKLLSIVLGEAHASPTYYVINRICKKLGSCVPSKKSVIRTLVGLGYTARSTHFNPTGIKSNASISMVKKGISQAL